ncbi:MAG: transporter [Rhodospirillales bacterium]|nr:transporter [Rhodospirillales bacterium]
MDGDIALHEMPAAANASSQHARPVRHVGIREWVGFLAMVFGMFMALLDIQIVSSSLSEIQAGLAASSDEIAWVQTAYLIAEVVMIPLSGYLSRVLSTRLLFVISATGFTLMSLGCAFATGIDSMIVCRALQGFIGGAMIPTVFATSFTLFPPNRGAAVGVLVGLIATMAPTLGPTIGGYLTQALSWHWLFLINIGPGILVATAVFLLVDIDRPDFTLLKGFDGAGLALMALFLGCLEYTLEEGPRWDWFADTSIATAALISAVSAGLFFWRMLSYHHPIVDLRAFADRNFALGCGYSFILGIGLYGAVYVQPVFLARVRGFNSLQIGEIMFVTGLFQFLSAPLAAILSKKLELRVMLGLGMALFATGLYLNAGLTNQTGFWELFVPQMVRGSALMLCFLPINTLTLGTLAPSKIKNASGLYNLMRNLGGALGLAAINTVLTDRLALHWARLSSHIDLTSPTIQNYLDQMSGRLSTLLPGDATATATRQLGNLLMREAYVMSFNDCLLLMAGVFAFGLATMPLIRKPRQAVGPGH